jgi:hypothetical protein
VKVFNISPPKTDFSKAACTGFADPPATVHRDRRNEPPAAAIILSYALVFIF